MLVSGHVLAYHKLQEKESLPVVLLAKQGYGQWEDDVIIILRFGVLQPVVSSENLSTVTRLQTPATYIWSERKCHPVLSLSAIRL